MIVSDLRIPLDRLPVVINPVEGGRAPDLTLQGLTRPEMDWARTVANVGWALVYCPGAVPYLDRDGRAISITKGYAKSAYAIIEVELEVLQTVEVADWAEDLITNEKTGQLEHLGHRWPWSLRVRQVWKFLNPPHWDWLKRQQGWEWGYQGKRSWIDVGLILEREVGPPGALPDLDRLPLKYVIQDPRLPVEHVGTRRASDAVYLLQTELRPRLLKIGSGFGDCKSRLQAALTYLPRAETRIVRHWRFGPGLGYGAELWLHERFAKRRVEGEWFKVGADEVERIVSYELLDVTLAELRRRVRETPEEPEPEL